MKTKHILYILISFTINICGKASCEVVYRQVIEEYDVSSIYTAGNLLSTCVMDSTGAKLTEVSNEYYSYGLTNTAASGVNGGKYYYHSDHLGSSVLVTDSCGLISQQVEYLTYGEVFLERQHNSDPSQPLYATPYKFNGKELDEETGLYYYGARYMNPRLSIWYATDPLQEKYPNISSYAYCAGDPIRLFDYNGCTIKAVSKVSGYRVLNEIHNSFYGKKFSKLNALFKLESDCKTMAKINKNKFMDAISGLNKDEKALAIGYFKAINDNKIHKVDMTMSYESLNKETIKAFSGSGYKKGKDVDRMAGGGVNKGIVGGTFTIVVMDSSAPIDFVLSANGNHYNRFSTPAELLAHELLGHGYARSVNSPNYQHKDAIQMTNLYWRVRGYHNFYRDGRYHYNGIILNKNQANGLPSFLKF